MGQAAAPNGKAKTTSKTTAARKAASSSVVRRNVSAVASKGKSSLAAKMEESDSEAEECPPEDSDLEVQPFASAELLLWRSLIA